MVIKLILASKIMFLFIIPQRTGYVKTAQMSIIPITSPFFFLHFNISVEWHVGSCVRSSKSGEVVVFSHLSDDLSLSIFFSLYSITSTSRCE